MLELDWKQFDVVVVDDEEDNLDAFRFAFRKTFRLHYALGGQAALDLVSRLDAAVVITDQRMPGMSGIEVLTRVKALRPDCAGILLTAYTEMGVLVDAVNSGAVDRYLQKPWDSKELTVTLKQCIGTFATVRENRRLREQLRHYAGYLEREGRDSLDFGELDVPSASMRAVAQMVADVAPTSTHVLVTGEEGGEHETVARAVHVGSPREERPFVRVACAAFPGDALERELFGWRRGAFEGAFDDRSGRVELADGGTLFLDMVERLTPALQARLLELAMHGKAERVGDTQGRTLDVRVVMGTTPRVAHAMQQGAVMRELWTRLAVFPIALPTLASRSGDVVPLAELCLRKFQRKSARAPRGLSSAASERLRGYAWPGQVRELEAVMERACVLAGQGLVEPAHLAFAESVEPAALPSLAGAEERALDTKLEELERAELLRALEACGGKKAEVARMLGIQRTTLYYRLKKLGIDA